ncbi:MAG: hypothetical protein M0P76_06265 [Candidatus Pacebacteria bacterium]|jgi:hypothetical protein|nr:hypothetical protein [Candidatus Paceibacterota bacterium]
MKKNILVIIAALFIFGCTYAFLYFRVGNTAGFVTSYRDLGVKWTQSEKNVYAPGANSNPVRQNLNATLVGVLDESVPEKDRFALAIAGADPLAELRAEIDVMRANREQLEQNVTTLREQSLKVEGIRIRQKAGEVVLLSEKRNVMIREIEEVSYRMNDTVKEIFQGIAKDNGALTDNRKQALNDQIPQAEKDYERLNELYRNLTESKTEMKKAYREFEGLAGK